MKRLVLFYSLIALSLLTACNTMAGLGQDIKKGGETLESIGR